MLDLLTFALILLGCYAGFLLLLLGLIALIKWPFDYVLAKRRIKDGEKQAVRLNAQARQRIADARAANVA